MKNYIITLTSLLYLVSIQAIADTDSVSCKLSKDRSVKAAYDTNNGSVTVFITENGHVSISKGYRYLAYSHNQIITDSRLMILVKMARLNVDEVSKATMFSIDENNDGAFAIFKFTDSNGKSLGASAFVAWAAMPCLK